MSNPVSRIVQRVRNGEILSARTRKMPFPLRADKVIIDDQFSPGVVDDNVTDE